MESRRIVFDLVGDNLNSYAPNSPWLIRRASNGEYHSSN